MRRAAIVGCLLAGAIVLAGIIRHQARSRVATSALGPPVFVVDGGGPMDPRPGGDTTWIACGDARCSLDRQVCCVYSFPPDRDPMPPALFACFEGTSCPPPGIGPHGGTGPPIAMRCASQANCSGDDVCCAMVGKMTLSSGCVDRDECGSGSEEEEKEREERRPESGGMRAQLCDPRAPVERNGCARGVACSPKGAAQWQLPPGFGTCGVAEEGPL